MKRSSIVALAVAACVVPAGPATAASVSVYHYDSDGHDPSTDSVSFDAAPGEVNDLTLSRAAVPGAQADDYRFSDPGATITADSGCTAQSPHTVVCRMGRAFPSVSVGLGDGDDHARSDTDASIDGDGGDDVIEGSGTLDGGEGDDHLIARPGAGGGRYATIWLRGGAGNDTLEGSPGQDLLAGGSGSDVVAGGGGDDTLAGQEPYGTGDADRDVVDGGTGVDTVHVNDARQSLRVDLRITAGQQVTGSADLITGMENVVAGPGDDVLIAADGGSDLRGGAGQDRLIGGPGPDRLDGGPGVDAIFGDAGPDNISSADGFRDAVHCGEGSDVVDGDAGDRVGASCERKMLSPLLSALSFVERRGSRMRVVYFCVDVVDDCAGEVTVSTPTDYGWRRVGAARIGCQEAPAPCFNDAQSGWMQLSSATMRSLRRAGYLTLCVVSSFNGGVAAGGLATRETVRLPVGRRRVTRPNFVPRGCATGGSSGRHR